VLLCDVNGLPIADSFIATSFSVIEEMFKNNTIAKFAYVHMAQALSLRVSAFCLTCLGTDNKFNAGDVLKIWKYLYLECQKHAWHYNSEFWCRRWQQSIEINEKLMSIVTVIWQNTFTAIPFIITWGKKTIPHTVETLV